MNERFNPPAPAELPPRAGRLDLTAAALDELGPVVTRVEMGEGAGW